MFGFGKKKLDDRTAGMVSIEIAMFMRWMETKHRKVLQPTQVKYIVKRVLERENLNCNENICSDVTTLAMSKNFDRIDELRKKSKFDENIDDFCKSIGISTP